MHAAAARPDATRHDEGRWRREAARLVREGCLSRFDCPDCWARRDGREAAAETLAGLMSVAHRRELPDGLDGDEVDFLPAARRFINEVL